MAGPVEGTSASPAPHEEVVESFDFGNWTDVMKVLTEMAFQETLVADSTELLWICRIPVS
jgi:hypothetical protein